MNHTGEGVNEIATASPEGVTRHRKKKERVILGTPDHILCVAPRGEGEKTRNQRQKKDSCST